MNNLIGIIKIAIIGISLNNAKTSYENQIFIEPNMRNWTVSNMHTLCKRPFIFKNEKWRSQQCISNTSFSMDQVECQLESEQYLIQNVHELTLTLRLNISQNSAPLYIFSVRQVNKKQDLTKYLGDGIDPTVTKGKTHELKEYIYKIDMANFIGISLQFKDFQGYCGSIYSLSLSYYTCMGLKSDLVTYPEENAPAVGKTLKTKGQCYRHAISSQKRDVYRTCNWNGEVKEFGTCVCYPGFTKYNKSCISCPSGAFKSKRGNQPCNICGANSVSKSDYHSCICNYGFFQKVDESSNQSAHCFDIRPTNLKFNYIKADSVNITWQSVDKNLTVGIISYIVDCDNCLNDEGSFPKKTYTNFAFIKNLNADKVYSISVGIRYSRMTKNEKLINIRGSFKTAGDLHGHEKTTILIVAITLTLVLLFTVLIISLYVVNKRKTSKFLQRINSLKRHRRPPPPPQSNETEGLEDEISPYAVFIPAPIPHLDTDEESDNEENKTNRTINSDNTDGYVSMTYNLKNKFLNRTKLVSNEYAPPFASSSYQSNNPDVRKSRTQSCYFRDSTGYELSFQQIEFAKSTNKYKSRECLDVSIPRRPHSADDVNKLHDVTTT